AKELIGKTALLEFKLVATGPQAGTPEHPGPGVQVLYGKGDAGGRRAYLVERRTLMTGDVLTDASVRPGTATEGMAVDFVLDARGTKLFGELWSADVGRNLAIALDNYRGGGVVADAALLLNVLFLVGAFAAFGFTLSLPGIAGIVLTIGMAVDANVLILERIREELRLGKTPRAAIETGYERAWYAIRDSNVTTFCSGLIMFQFGSGPVRGFAV